MRVRVRAWGDADTAHEGGGRVDLGAGTGDAHVAELMRHAAGLDAGLARIVRHSRGHGRMAGWYAWVLLHCAGVRRERRTHAGHHFWCVDYPRRGVDIDGLASALSHALMVLSRG